MNRRKILPWVAAGLPRKRLQQIETLAGLAQGKGWGAASVRQEVRICLGLLGAANHRCLLAIDVGANVGDWSRELLELEPEAEVIAYEPNPDSAAVARRRLGDLGTGPSPTVVESAVGSDDGFGVLTGLDGPASHNSLRPGSAQEFSFADLAVELVRLDSQTHRWQGRPVDILKIDVEGAEWEVLQGAGEILDTAHVVQFELGEGSLTRRVYFLDYWSFFQSRGFDLWIQTPRGAARIPSYASRWESFSCTNFFAQRRKT